MRAQEERVISTDEMTGIQALERKAPDKQMRPGKPTKREFEYIRHGTQTLIASFDVSRGKIVHETIGQTRTEADFLTHLQQMVRAAPGVKKWHLVMDCLNTDQSESLVRWVGSIEGIRAVTLGKKGESGILQSMATRAEFLTSDPAPPSGVYPEHRSVYPAPCSGDKPSSVFWASGATLLFTQLRVLGFVSS